MLLGIYLTAVNLLLFFLMGADKRLAAKGRRRVPERRLFVFAWLGGAAGGWIGMRMWRHKTKHSSFMLGLPALTALHLVLLAFAYYNGWIG